MHFDVFQQNPETKSLLLAWSHKYSENTFETKLPMPGGETSVLNQIGNNEGRQIIQWIYLQ